MILALKTGTEENTLKILDKSGQVKFDKTWPASRELSEELPGLIEDALTGLNLTFQDVSGIIGFKGPGSYTGLRIGITVINTIANQVHAPIVGISESEAKGDWIQAGLKKLAAGENDQIILLE
jgi:tRNA threonylcarbamoyladenosine biosynthesis protein TsaB